jgi:hypothetical protein
MAGSAYYSTGTASVAEGERIVTGFGTGWKTETGGLSPIKAGDKFGIHVGRPILIDSVDGNTQITLADPWPGPSQEAGAYKVELTSPQIVAIDAMRQLFASLSSGNLTSLSALQLDDQQIPIALGPGVFGTIDRNDLVQGVTFDAEVPALADRAAYDREAKGFRVLVSDIGNGRSAFFTKTSAAVADWSVPFYLSGEQGTAGPFTELTFGNVTTLPAGEPASATVVQIDADTVRLDLSLPKGADGEGGGDVAGPSGATDGAIAVADGVTGKQIKFVTPAQARATIGAGGPLATFRNQIINGDFDVWQRATSQTTSGFGSDDRWRNTHDGATKTHSRQAFAPGQTDVPGSPEFFSRTVVNSVAGAQNNVVKYQTIERVQTLEGKRATLTFYAKANAEKNLAVEFMQNFGSGGAASPTVYGIGKEKVALGTTWQKYTMVVDIPSIAGKVLGSNANSWLGLIFWFDAGSSFSDRSSGLGHQSGTFDLAHVSLVEGDATGEADPFSPRHIQEELALCMRYYEVLTDTIFSLVSSNSVGSKYSYWNFKVRKRATPTMANTGVAYGSINANVTFCLIYSTAVDEPRLPAGASADAEL